MYDLFSSRERYEDFNLFTLEDVDAAFSRITPLKYNQSQSLKGKGQGICITPLPAGHMIGGTIWKILKDGEEEIIYAVDFNHKRERHLNRCTLDTISKPSVLIIDACNADYNPPRRTERDQELMTTILNTLRNRGNVLICVDTAGRSLELAYMLDQLWKDPKSGLLAYSLALLNSVSSHVIEFAKGQVEWMSEKIVRSFEVERYNPFHLKHVHICLDMAALANVREPCVVLASQPDLESGFSRELFINWASHPNNSIILTQRCSQLTLASQLMELAQVNPVERLTTLEINEKIPLQGMELEEYRWMWNKKKAEEEAQRRKAAQEEEDAADSDEEEEEDDPMGGSSASRKPVSKTHDLMIGDGKQRVGGFFKHKKSYPMYPCVETKVKWDDYGEFINPEDFMIFDTSTIATNSQARVNEENKENLRKEELEKEKEEDKIPTKCVTRVQTFQVLANIQFIDFEGRSDGDSLKKIIANMKPRRVILVRGSEEATASLSAYCDQIRNEIFLDHVFAPRVGQVVDATTESHIYQVRLKDSLVSSLRFHQSKDGAEIAWVEGEIEMPTEESLLGLDAKNDVQVLEPLSQESSAAGRELLPTLTSLPPHKVAGHVTIFINELKLSDFKHVLIRNGVQAEFSGGVLYCSNQSVAIRRNEAGRIQFEGTLCEDYFKIRDLLYTQYAIL